MLTGPYERQKMASSRAWSPAEGLVDVVERRRVARPQIQTNAVIESLASLDAPLIKEDDREYLSCVCSPTLLADSEIIIF